MHDFCPFRASVPPLDASLGRGRKNGASCAPQKNGAPEPHAPTLCSPKLRTTSPAPRPSRLSTAPRRYSSQAARTEKSFYPVFLSVRARPHSKAPVKEDAPSQKRPKTAENGSPITQEKHPLREKKESATPPHERYRERGCPRFFGRASELRAKGKERQNKYLWYLPLTSARRPQLEPPFFVPPPLLVASDGRDVAPIPARRKRAPP